MKKNLKITLLLLLLIVIGYFTYTHFKKTSILLDVIHKDAESVLKIGIHDISKTLVLDALSSPSYYWKNTSKSSDKQKKDTIEDNDIGVDLKPFSLVFYTIKNIENTFFSTLKIYNSKDFEHFIKSYSKKKSVTISSDKNGYKYLVLEKTKFVAAWNSDKIAIAVSPEVNLDKAKTIFEDVLLNNKLISDKNHPIIQSLSSDRNHLLYKNKENTIVLNFEDEKAIIDGLFYTKKPNTYKTKTVINNGPSDVSLALYFDANLNSIENKNLFIEKLKGISFFSKNNIDVNDFIDNTNGLFSLEINGKTIQLDTIISYEYDDNFEKIAKKSIQEKSAPKVSIYIDNKEGKNLYNYLETQGAIENGILKAIPYYTFYAKKDTLNTIFSTTKDILKTKKITNPNFFRLGVNFESLKEDLEIPQIKEVFSLLNTLELKAQQVDNSNKINIYGSIKAKNETINIMSQIFFGLQKTDSISK